MINWGQSHVWWSDHCRPGRVLSLLLRAKAVPLIKSAEWRHKANQILWSLMSPVIPGMVFIIHWFDHRMNLHKNKAWWIHYLMIPVVMITALILIIRWDETWSDGNTTPRDDISQSRASMGVTDQSEAGARSPQFTSVWGPFTDNEPCPASVPWPALLSPDSNWFVYHDVDHCVPSLLEISGHQTPAAWSLIIIPGLSSSCGGSTPDSTPGTSFQRHWQLSLSSKLYFAMSHMHLASCQARTLLKIKAYLLLKPHKFPMHTPQFLAQPLFASPVSVLSLYLQICDDGGDPPPRHKARHRVFANEPHPSPVARPGQN